MQDYLDDINKMHKFVGLMTETICGLYGIKSTYVSENASVGGPMTCIYNLQLSEDMPAREDLERVCKQLKDFAFPISIEIPIRELGFFMVSIDYVGDNYLAVPRLK